MSEADGTPGLLVSPRLEEAGVPHAFTTRVGGASRGVFASLNFGNPMHLSGADRDPASNIAENFRRVLAVIGAGGREVVQVYQVHGGAARAFRAGNPSRDAGAGPAGETIDFKADALVTDDPARVVAVRVADCVPVLLASADGRIVAAVHAGWRGVAAGVALAAVRAMRGLGAVEIVGAIGPCISAAAFEVGPEVVAALRAALGEAASVRAHPDPVARAAGKAMVDLPESLRRQLADFGVGEVDVIARCTVGEPDAFFSHRRDKGVTGRMVGVIGPRAATAS
jgi:hypothetical protein